MDKKIELAISGYNAEKAILSESLPRLGHNDSIKVRGRLNEIDRRISKLINN